MGLSGPLIPCKVASAGGSSSVFCNEWLFLCAYFYACLESVVADRTGMATRLLSSGVAMCVERCRFGT